MIVKDSFCLHMVLSFFICYLNIYNEYYSFSYDLSSPLQDIGKKMVNNHIYISYALTSLS